MKRILRRLAKNKYGEAILATTILVIVTMLISVGINVLFTYLDPFSAPAVISVASMCALIATIFQIVCNAMHDWAEQIRHDDELVTTANKQLAAHASEQPAAKQPESTLL